MTDIIPHITADSWEVNGDTLTAWIGGGLEFLDISPSPDQEDLWLLHCNHVSGKLSYLGAYGRIEDAQGAARAWLGDDDEG